MEDDRHRRSDDAVSYREMVEFVARASERDASIRAESLLLISNTLEKVEAQAAANRAKLEERLDRHEDDHRAALETLLAAGRQNRIAVAAVIVAALSVIVTLVIGIATLHP